MSPDFKRLMLQLAAVGAVLLLLILAAPMVWRGSSAASDKAGTYVTCKLQLCPPPTPGR